MAGLFHGSDRILRRGAERSERVARQRQDSEREPTSEERLSEVEARMVKLRRLLNQRRQ